MSDSRQRQSHGKRKAGDGSSADQQAQKRTATDSRSRKEDGRNTLCSASDAVDSDQESPGDHASHEVQVKEERPTEVTKPTTPNGVRAERLAGDGSSFDQERVYVAILSQDA